MGVFNNSRQYDAPARLIGTAADALESRFRSDGYEVSRQELMSGGVDVSISSGGTFKAVVGMKTALKVVIMPMSGGISAEASVGIFGQQAIPTVISMLFLWPVLLTQIWGLVKQSKLDDLALDTIGEAISSQSRHAFGAQFPSGPSEAATFCPDCGKSISAGVRFCPWCGTQLMK